MKKYGPPLLLLLSVLTTTKIFAQEGYRLRGNISDTCNGRYIYLYGIDYSRLNPQIRDSALIQDGQFSFTGKINSIGLLVSLYFKQAAFSLSQFYIENRDIQLQVGPSSNENPLDNITIINSPVANQFRQWQQQTGTYNMPIYTLKKTIDSLEKNGVDISQSALMDSLQQMKQKRLTSKVDFIVNHPDYYISLQWLRCDIFSSLDKMPDSLYQLFRHLSPSLQTSTEGKQIEKDILALVNRQVGKEAPAFTLPDINGQLVSLKSYRGKYVLLDFWASWCGPCVEKIPALKAAYAKLHNKGLDVIGISLDNDKDKWLAAVKKYDLNWTNVSELKKWDGPVGLAYAISYIPQAILIDPAGKIVALDVEPEALSRWLP